MRSIFSDINLDSFDKFDRMGFFFFFNLSFAIAFIALRFFIVVTEINGQKLFLKLCREIGKWNKIITKFDQKDKKEQQHK